jgi:hypothetical protein
MNFSFRMLIKAIPVLIWVAQTHGAILYTAINQDSLTIGERIELTVSIVAPKGTSIIPPATEQGFGSFSVKEWNSDRISRPDNDSLTFKYLLTTYTVDTCSIPALPFLLPGTDSAADTLLSRVIPIRVISVIQAKQGDTIDIKDLKPQQLAGKPSLMWLWILLTFIAIAGLSFFGRVIWLKTRKPAPPPPPLPPYEEAIEALNRLESKNYISRGLIKEYVFELSDILKRYVERRWDVNAVEFTTEELLDWLAASPVESSNRKIVDWFFRTSDPIKFAKFVPDVDTLARFAREIRGFFTATKPMPVAAAGPAAPTNVENAAKKQPDPAETGQR